MTVTSAPSGPSVVRRGPRARSFARLRRVVAMAALAVVAAPLMVAAPLTLPPAHSVESLGAAAAATPTPSPTPSPTPTTLTGETVFTLAPVANGTVRPGDGFAVSVSLFNGTATATAPVTVTLSLGAAPLGSRAALTAWLGSETAGVAVTPIGSTEMAAVAPGTREVEGIVLVPGDPVLAGRAPGVYPLSASYATADGTVVATSTMIVPPDSGEAGIGVVVPITAGATDEGLLTALDLAALTSPTGSLTDQLDAVEGTPAILAVDPAIPAAIRVLGTSAPASATEWLARLESLANSRFALQFGDADVAAQLQAGIARPLRPLSLQAYMKPADFPPAPDATTTPTPSGTATDAPTANPDAPAYPTIAELTDIGGARAGVYWPATGSATPAVVAGLGAADVDDRTSLTLVPSTSTRAGSGGATVAGRATAGEAELLVYDADVSRELNEASNAGEGELRGAPLTAATAYLAFAVAESGGNPLVVTLDRGQDRSRIAMRTAITSAAQAPGVTPLTLGGVAGRLPVAVEIADAPVDDARVAAASALVADEASIARFATILDDVTLLTGPERAEILQVLGIAWLTRPQEWQTAVARHRAGTNTTLGSVGLLPPTPASLISADAPIPIWVRNDLPWPVTVVLYATPDDLRLNVNRATEVTAQPRSNTRVQIPVKARVGAGEVSVQLQLRSRTLEPIGAPEAVQVTVRADWEGVGIIILSVLVGGFLLLGVVRTLLRLRRRSRRASTGTTDAEGAVPGTRGAVPDENPGTSDVVDPDAAGADVADEDRG